VVNIPKGKSVVISRYRDIQIDKTNVNQPPPDGSFMEDELTREHKAETPAPGTDNNVGENHWNLWKALLSPIYLMANH
jgi:hypothetical protein